MTARRFSIASGLLIAISLATTQIASSKEMKARTGVDASAILKDIDQGVLRAADDADQLRQLVENPLYSWHSHALRLTALKDDVNRMVREINTLEAERDSLTPWEQQAVDQTLPLINETATDTAKALKDFNENQTRLWTGDYRERANNIWRDSERIAKTLGDRLKLEKMQEEEKQLGQRLGEAGN